MLHDYVYIVPILQHVQHPHHVGMIHASEDGDLIPEQLGIARIAVHVDRFYRQVRPTLTVDASADGPERAGPDHDRQYLVRITDVRLAYPEIAAARALPPLPFRVRGGRHPPSGGII